MKKCNIADRLIKNSFHTILFCEMITEGGGKYALPFGD